MKKWSLWVHEQYTDALFMKDFVNNYYLEKKNAEKGKSRRANPLSKHLL